jgi:hypothetical protein
MVTNEVEANPRGDTTTKRSSIFRAKMGGFNGGCDGDTLHAKYLNGRDGEKEKDLFVNSDDGRGTEEVH